MTPFAVPDAIEPVVGWRYWRVDKKEGLLHSLSGAKGFLWQPNTRFEARCPVVKRSGLDGRYRFISGMRVELHDAPGEMCRCGIYAARDLTHLRRQMLAGLAINVVGEVSLWGKLIPGSKGYRAEYAYPRRLFVIQRTAEWDQSAVAGALSVYGVPVETISYRRVGFNPLATLGEFLRRLRSPREVPSSTR
ncbi:MAG: hypothetical protein ACRDK3_17115 [Actinomycetota bacterium]